MRPTRPIAGQLLALCMMAMAAVVVGCTTSPDAGPSGTTEPATPKPPIANPQAYRFRDIGQAEPSSPFCAAVGAEEYTYIEPGRPPLHKLATGGFWFIRDRITYISTDALDREPTVPAKWTRMSFDEMNTYESYAGLVSTMAEDNRPRVEPTVVDTALRRNGLPDPIDRELIRGSETTHYRVGLLPADWYPLALGVRNKGEERLPASANDIDVWVDGQDRIRRMRGTFVNYTPAFHDGISEQPGPVQTPIEYEWFAFGEPPPIELPDESDAVPFGRLPATVLRPDDPCGTGWGVDPTCDDDESFDRAVRDLTVDELYARGANPEQFIIC